MHNESYDEAQHQKRVVSFVARWQKREIGQRQDFQGTATGAEDEDEILGSKYARNVGGTILEHVNKGRKRGKWTNE